MSPRDEGAGTQWKIKEEIKEELGMSKIGCGGVSLVMCPAVPK